MDRETLQELQNLENDKRLNQVVLTANQERIANELKGEMGQDMIDVLEGRKFVRLSLWDKFKNWFYYEMDKILRAL